MIDNMAKTTTLVENMRAALPIGAEITARTHQCLQDGSPDLAFPHRCLITEIHYVGDGGGVVCKLDFGVPDAGKVHFVSITHLTFNRRTPLSREIRLYQKHRIKRLRKLEGAPC